MTIIVTKRMNESAWECWEWDYCNTKQCWDGVHAKQKINRTIVRTNRNWLVPITWPNLLRPCASLFLERPTVALTPLADRQAHTDTQVNMAVSFSSFPIDIQVCPLQCGVHMRITIRCAVALDCVRCVLLVLLLCNPTLHRAPVHSSSLNTPLVIRFLTFICFFTDYYFAPHLRYPCACGSNGNLTRSFKHTRSYTVRHLQTYPTSTHTHTPLARACMHACRCTESVQDLESNIRGQGFSTPILVTCIRARH